MSAGGLIALNSGMQLLQGIGEASGLRQQASVQDRNAAGVETQGGYDALESLRRSRAQQGSDIVGAAASGSGLGGSLGDLLEANAVSAQMEAMNIRYSAATKARAYRQDAENMRHNATTAIFGGIMRAGASALTGMQSKANFDKISAAQWGVPQPVGTIPIPALPSGAGGRYTPGYGPVF